MLIALAFIGLGITQACSFETRAARVPVILKQLQVKTGKNLSCSEEFKNEVLVVSVRDVEPTVLLNKIARACVGTWETEGNGLVLKPDVGRRAEQETQRVAKRVARVQAMLDQFTKELGSPYDGVLPSERHLGSDYPKARLAPISRLAMRLMIGLGAKKLAASERGTRQVFALNPNSVQQALPRGAAKAVEEFRKEWALSDRASSEPDGTQPGAETWRANSGPRWTMTPDGRIEQVWLSVKDPLRYLSDGVKIAILDSDGNMMGRRVHVSPPEIPQP